MESLMPEDTAESLFEYNITAALSLLPPNMDN